MTEHAHLTDAEVEEATYPLVQGAARIRFFRRLGCKVKPKPNGQPLVGREEYRAAMSSQKRIGGTPTPARVYDFAALRAAGAGKPRRAA